MIIMKKLSVSNFPLMLVSKFLLIKVNFPLILVSKFLLIKAFRLLTMLLK